MPGDAGVTVVTTLVCFVFYRTRGCGRYRSARHSLRPLFFGRRNVMAKLARIARREGEAVSARHCLRQTQSVCAREHHDEAIRTYLLPDGLLRGACHRARIRATH